MDGSSSRRNKVAFSDSFGLKSVSESSVFVTDECGR